MHFNLIALPVSSVDLWPITSNSPLLRGGGDLCYLLSLFHLQLIFWLLTAVAGRLRAHEEKKMSDALLHGDGPVWETTTAQWHFSTAQQRGMCVLKTKRGGWGGSASLWWSCGCGRSFRTAPQQGWNYNVCVCTSSRSGRRFSVQFSTERMKNWKIRKLNQIV